MIARSDTYTMERRLELIIRALNCKKQENEADFHAGLRKYFNDTINEIVEMETARIQHLTTRFAFETGKPEFDGESVYLRNYLYTNVYSYLGRDTYVVNLVDEDFTNKEVLDSIRKWQETKEVIDAEYKEAKKVIDLASNKYGSVQYMLTQIPELRPLCDESFRRNLGDWQPNKNYKVFSRDDVLKECDPTAITALLGAAVLEGVDINADRF